jgi:hypothetical protein
MAAKKVYEFNPLCEIFPLIEGKEFTELVKDIQENGLREPIQLDADGRILDGRNRYRACQEALRPDPERFVKWKGKATPQRYAEFIASRNIVRRHLTAAQRAQMVVKLNEAVLASAGGNRQEAITKSQETPMQTQKALDKNYPMAHEKTRPELAREAGVSEAAIAKATRVHAIATPEQEAAVIAGTLKPADVLEPDPDDFEAPATRTCDVSGRELIDAMAAEWEDAERQLGEWKRDVDRIRRGIQSACENEDSCAAFIHLQAVTAHAKNLAYAIRSAMPHCICPACAGDGTRCKPCRGRGWVTKDVYTQEVPVDCRWMPQNCSA